MNKESIKEKHGLCLRGVCIMICVCLCSVCCRAGAETDFCISEVRIKDTDPLLVEVKSGGGDSLYYDSEARWKSDDYCYSVVPESRKLTEEEQDKLFSGLELKVIPAASGSVEDAPTVSFDPETGKMCLVHAVSDFEPLSKFTSITMGNKWVGTVYEVSEGKKSSINGIRVNAWIMTRTVSFEDNDEKTLTHCITVFYIDDWYVLVETSDFESVEAGVRKNAETVLKLIHNGISSFDLHY